MIRQVENTPVGANDKPERDVVIVDCGEVPEGTKLEDFTKKAPDTTGDAYEDFPEDQLGEGQEWKGSDIAKIATDLKEMGNKAFKAGDLQVGLSKYQKGLRYLHEIPGPVEGDPPELNSQLNQLKISLYTNSSMLQYKLKQYGESFESADKALSIEGIDDKQKAKALFRKGVAAKDNKNEEEATKCLQAAEKLNPADPAIKNELAAVKKAAADRRAKEKKAYGKMFS